MLISVITPVYNVEPYIHDYFSGVLNQTYRNLEIICIDDGSPDDCGKILDEYAGKDPRLKVIHQANNGYAYALNRALDCVNGHYVSFIDPDDLVELNFYKTVLGIARTTGADIVVSSFYRDYPDKCKKMENSKPVHALFENKNDAFRYGFEADVYGGFKMFLWNKLFSSRFFRSKKFGGLGLKMQPGLSTGGDVLLTAECFLNANKFSYTPEAFYHYRIRENSLMRNVGFARRLGLNNALDQIAQILALERFEENTINLVKRFHTYYCSQLVEFAHSIGDKPNLDFSKNEMRKYLNEYIESNSKYPERIDRICRILEADL